MFLGLARTSDAAVKSTHYVRLKSDESALIEGEEDDIFPASGRSLVQERIANLRRTSKGGGMDSDTLQVKSISVVKSSIKNLILHSPPFIYHPK